MTSVMDTVETTVAPEQTLNAPAGTAPAAPNVAPVDHQDVADPETPEQAEPESEEDKTSKTLERMERRIKRLTAARYEAEARAKMREQQLQEFQQRLQQEAQPQEEQPVRPEDVLSLAERIAQQRMERDRVVTTIKHVLSSGRELEGFDDACNTLNEITPFYGQRGEPSPFLQVVLESEAPAKVLHYLGSNPEIAEELAGLNAIQQARRIARLEAKLSEPEAPKVSKAPKPVSPVRGASRDDGGLNDNIPVEEWARRFRERMSKR